MAKTLVSFASYLKFSNQAIIWNSALQVEDLTRKSQLLEAELEKKSKQFSEAIELAGEETTKCKAAKEVIKSLTTQVVFLSPK